MYAQTLYPKTKQVLEELSKSTVLSNWYLAGGTGLALQLGHRKSIDLDFFTADFPEQNLFLASIGNLKPQIINEASGTLDLMVDNVKVSFFEYKYPILTDLKDFQNIKVADVLDIACMKITAISSRGSKKDFIDLHFILKKYTLGEIIKAVSRKYQGVDYQKMHLLKSQVYFNDAEADPMPDMLIDENWDEIKLSLETKVKKYLSESEII